MKRKLEKGEEICLIIQECFAVNFGEFISNEEPRCVSEYITKEPVRPPPLLTFGEQRNSMNIGSGNHGVTEKSTEEKQTAVAARQTGSEGHHRQEEHEKKEKLEDILRECSIMIQSMLKDMV